MSFQHFRLQAIAPHPVGETVTTAGPSSLGNSSLSQALGLQPHSNGVIQGQLQGFHLQPLQNGLKKGPYGSGDADDGYTLVFETMEAFQSWRRTEEEEKMVEFVKGDTHGSKAVPPRFKDHTKLVCARHSRSGRKKYVKKYPDRVRKVPSRKLEGQGCSASISYKTYFDSDQVRACYVAEHSHEIGLANLPFTKRGRKAQADQQSRAKRARTSDDGNHSESSPSPPATPEAVSAPPAGPSIQQPQQVQPAAPPQPIPPQPVPPPEVVSPPLQQQQHQPATLQSAIEMLAPLPPGPPPLPPHIALPQARERWQRVDAMYRSISQHAQTFVYPEASLAALESVLIRLYLESPIGGYPPQQPPPA